MPQQTDTTSTIVYNAGIVLLDGYFPTLFERLGFMHEGQFVDAEESHRQAALALQYLATGNPESHSDAMPLNKLLVGLDLSPEPISGMLNEDQRAIADRAIASAIRNWPAAGEASPAGFRETWLQREGTLVDDGERWVLQVQPRPYDVLISRSPFSFSIIHFPWMKKLLKVSWAG